MRPKKWLRSYKIDPRTGFRTAGPDFQPTLGAVPQRLASKMRLRRGVGRWRLRSKGHLRPFCETLKFAPMRFTLRPRISPNGKDTSCHEVILLHMRSVTRGFKKPHGMALELVYRSENRCKLSGAPAGAFPRPPRGRVGPGSGPKSAISGPTPHKN